MSINWGKAIVGGAAAYFAVKMLSQAFGRTDAALKKLEEKCPGNDPKCKIVPAGKDIETRATYIAEMVWNSSLDPKTVELAQATLNKKCDGVWCVPPRDHYAEVKALADAVYEKDSELWDAIEGHFAWARENLAYRKDHAYVDRFSSLRRTRKNKGSDCDDYTIALGALNLASGFRVGERIYQTVNAPSDFDHIAALVEVPPHSGKWHVLDASVERVREGGKVKAVYPGWGAPKRILKRWVDFEILPGGKVRKIGSGP